MLQDCWNKYMTLDENNVEEKEEKKIQICPFPFPKKKSFHFLLLVLGFFTPCNIKKK